MNDNYSDIMIGNSFDRDNDDADTTRNKKEKVMMYIGINVSDIFFLNSVKRGTKRQRERR